MLYCTTFFLNGAFFFYYILKKNLFMWQVNGTACAVPRLIMAIAEHYQTPVSAFVIGFELLEIFTLMISNHSSLCPDSIFPPWEVLIIYSGFVFHSFVWCNVFVKYFLLFCYTFCLSPLKLSLSLPLLISLYLSLSLTLTLKHTLNLSLLTDISVCFDMCCSSFIPPTPSIWRLQLSYLISSH